MTENPEKKLSILMTMCLQNDFIQKLDPLSDENIKNVHIAVAETDRLWGSDGKLEKFIEKIMEIGEKNDNIPLPERSQFYHYIHIRDWHDETDPTQLEELNQWKPHCIKGTTGAQFISPLQEYINRYRKFNIIVNSNSLNSFVNTDLESHLEALKVMTGCSKNQTVIGIIGVMTNVKILFLAYDLTVRYEFPKQNVILCEDLCAGRTSDGHEMGRQFISEILGLKFLNLAEFEEALNLQ